MVETHVVGAAIREGSRILAAQRSSSMKMPLKWEFAGGKVENGETHQQALTREVMEELGIRIAVKDYLTTGRSCTEKAEIILHVYEACIIEGEPTAKEHKQIKWINVGDLITLDWAEADIPACKKLVEMYGTRAINE